MDKRKRVKNKKPAQKALRKKTPTLYQLNPNNIFLNELKALVIKISPPTFPNLEKTLKKIGRLKLAIVTGVFLDISNARVDLMVVGDDIEYRRFNDFIKKLESNLGLELRYVVLGSNEFAYRYNMFDRFVHDILEYPHKKLINRLSYLK